MAKSMWVKVNSPGALSEAKKQEVTAKANELIENVLKPKHIEPNPNTEFNYLINIYVKWARGYLYFYSTYKVNSPNAIKPTFDDSFARLQYISDDKFDLAFKRHTGQWITLNTDATIEECLKAIEEGGWFTP